MASMIKMKPGKAVRKPMPKPGTKMNGFVRPNKVETMPGFTKPSKAKPMPKPPKAKPGKAINRPMPKPGKAMNKSGRGK
jgi:hypothetical protein